MKKNKNKKKIIIISLIIIVVLAVVLYLIFFKKPTSNNNDNGEDVNPTSEKRTNGASKDRFEDPNGIYITRNGVKLKEKVPNNIVGYYQNFTQEKDSGKAIEYGDYFALYDDGTAEATTPVELMEEYSKTTFSGNDLTFEIIYNDDSVLVNLILKNKDLEKIYGKYFQSGKSMYSYIGKYDNGEYIFEPTINSSVATVGRTKYISQ